MVNLKSKQIDPMPDGFSSYEETAEFWDTHDTMDYPDAFQDVDIKAEFRKRHYQVEVYEDEGTTKASSETRHIY
jgi:hypothetical protein